MEVVKIEFWRLFATFNTRFTVSELDIVVSGSFRVQIVLTETRDRCRSRNLALACHPHILDPIAKRKGLERQRTFSSLLDGNRTGFDCRQR